MLNCPVFECTEKRGHNMSGYTSIKIHILAFSFPMALNGALGHFPCLFLAWLCLAPCIHHLTILYVNHLSIKPLTIRAFRAELLYYYTRIRTYELCPTKAFIRKKINMYGLCDFAILTSKLAIRISLQLVTLCCIVAWIYKSEFLSYRVCRLN